MPVSPLTVAIGFAVICAAMFVLGLRAFRAADPPSGTTVEQAKRFGRLMMMGATAMFLFLVAVIVHGDFPLTAKG